MSPALADDTTHTLCRTLHLNGFAITHMQERPTDGPDPHASASAHPAAMPVASPYNTPDMPTTMASPLTLRKERLPAIIAHDWVMVYSMLQPGLRQHEVAPLKVCKSGLAVVMHQLAKLLGCYHGLGVCWDLATQLERTAHRSWDLTGLLFCHCP